MGTANAFDMLILPMLQCTLGIFAVFATIAVAQMAIGLLSRSSEGSTKATIDPARVRSRHFRARTPVIARARSKRLELSR